MKNQKTPNFSTVPSRSSAEFFGGRTSEFRQVGGSPYTDRVLEQSAWDVLHKYMCENSLSVFNGICAPLTYWHGKNKSLRDSRIATYHSKLITFKPTHMFIFDRKNFEFSVISSRCKRFRIERTKIIDKTKPIRFTRQGFTPLKGDYYYMGPTCEGCGITGRILLYSAGQYHVCSTCYTYYLENGRLFTDAGLDVL